MLWWAVNAMPIALLERMYSQHLPLMAAAAVVDYCKKKIASRWAQGTQVTYLLQAARTTTTGAFERSYDFDDFLAQIVKDLHCKWSWRSTTVHCTAIIFFSSKVHPLSQSIFYFIFICSFNTSYYWKRSNINTVVCFLHSQLFDLIK